MVVDARPRPDAVQYDDTTAYWRPRIQLRDAAFSLEHTPSQSIYFKDYDTGIRGGERGPRQGRPPCSTTTGSTGSPDARAGRRSPEARREHQGQERERRP